MKYIVELKEWSLKDGIWYVNPAGEHIFQDFGTANDFVKAFNSDPKEDDCTWYLYAHAPISEKEVNERVYK